MLQVKNIFIRRLLFLGLCIPLRTTAVILAKKNVIGIDTKEDYKELKRMF